MRPLFSGAAPVPLRRVLAEHRRVLIPLGLVLAVNLVVLGAVVLPLSQRVEGHQARADAAQREERAAAVELKRAEELRDGKSRATTDLDTFYTHVLPRDVAAARRLTHLKFQQMARQHDVQYQRGATSEDQIRGSALDRLTVAMTLSGDYDDIRSLIYELETSADFLVIDNMALTEGSEAGAPLSLALEVSTYFRTTRPAAAQAGSNGR